MAPPAKRKRGDSSYSGEDRDDGQRPSPHRPGDLNLGQHSVQQRGQPSSPRGRGDFDQRGGARRGRGGRAGRGGNQRSPQSSPISSNFPSQNAEPAADTHGSARATSSAANVTSTTEAAPDSSQRNGIQEGQKVPYFPYKHLVDDKMEQWTTTGRAQVVEEGRKLRDQEDSDGLARLYQELIHAGRYRLLDPEDAGAVIRDILELTANNISDPYDMFGLGDDPPFDGAEVFLDLLSIVAELAPVGPSLETLVKATFIPAQQMRQLLDASLLENLGLVRKGVFTKMSIRHQTNLLYRQSNYNLLREESEGYAKLVTDLFATSTEELPSNEVVEETFQRVKGMIGAFDLDVGRVLDITLDVFASVVVKHYRFVIKYLRTSSWWPQYVAAAPPQDWRLGPLPRWAIPGGPGKHLTGEEKEDVRKARAVRDEAFWRRAREIGVGAFFELGNRQVDRTSLDEAKAAIQTSEGVEDEVAQNWIDITGTLPPPGNRDAAQILGFKLRFYSSNARDPSDVLPANLIYLAVLLIKTGFLSLNDLYPHLWPGDEEMGEVKTIKLKEKEERDRLKRPGGGVPNALMSAGALPDDTIDSQSRDALRPREAEAARRQGTRTNPATERSTPAPDSEEKTQQLSTPTDQKVELLKGLLAIGAIPEALFMLGRFPWLPDAFPELPEYVHRILHHILEKVYRESRPMQAETILRRPQHAPGGDQSGVARGDIKMAETPPLKGKRWGQLEQRNINGKDENFDYDFYWDEWADLTPSCQTVDDVFTLCATFANITWVKIGQDPSLLTKITRIGTHSLNTDPSPANTSRWVSLSTTLLVPALSLTKCNPGVVNEVFELIKHFPYQTRYDMYTEWNLGPTSRLSDIKAASDLARAETRDVLKRMSKENIKPMARALAKVAYANPGVVFQVAFRQLESYENIVDVVVECARYFTFLAYDVLTWSLLNSLGGGQRDGLQADGLLTSKWLAALSLFAGKVFRRYSVLTPTPVIQYVAHKLHGHDSTDLIVLEEIIKSMSGIVSDSNFNDAQVLAMAGGDLLQAQTLLQLHDRRHECKTTAKRLMKSLTDSKLAGYVLVLLAQENQTCVFNAKEKNPHPKLLGNTLDQLRRIFVQYHDFLQTNLSVKDFDQHVPSIIRLVSEYGVKPDLAFWIGRSSLAAAIAEYDKSPEGQARIAKIASLRSATGDVKASGRRNSAEVVKSPSEGSQVVGSPEPKESADATKDIAMQDIGESDPASQNSASSSSDPRGPWHPVLWSVMQGLEAALPDSTWKALSPGFFVTFWQSSSRDAFLHFNSYDAEIARQNRLLVLVTNNKADMSTQGIQKRESQKRALMELTDSLRTESKERLAHHQQVRRRFTQEKDQWFANSWGQMENLSVALIEQCFFPRLILSPVDAKYAFNMLKYLHSSGAANFRTLGLYDQFFKDQRLSSIIFLCSAKEAECLGRFLNDILGELGRWHANKDVFEKEAYGQSKNLPGFAKKISKEQEVVGFWDFEDFRRILFKWHRQLSNALKACLTGKEYMHIRNAINILSQVHQNFPAVNFMGQHQVTYVTDLSKNETRQDLKLAAASLLGALKRREKEWVMPQAFSQVENTNGSGVRSGAAKPSAPQTNGDTSKTLNPQAAEFQPLSEESKSKDHSTATTGKKRDAEDGEIQDGPAAKQRKVTSQDISASSAQNPSEISKPADQKTAHNESSVAAQTPNQRGLVTPSVSGIANSNGRAETDARAAPSFASNEANTSTKVHPPAKPPPRSDPARPPPDLPSRPEAAPTRKPEHRVPTRVNERPPLGRGRDSRGPDRPPFDGPKDGGRSFERPVSTNPSFRGSEKTNGPHQDEERGRLERYPSDVPSSSRTSGEGRQGHANTREPIRPHRDDRPPPMADSRISGDTSHGRRDIPTPHQHERETHMMPPRSNAPQQMERPSANHTQHDPARASMNNPRGDRRMDQARYNEYPPSEHGSRGPPLPQSPHERPPAYEARRGDRRYEDAYREYGDDRHPRARYDEPPPVGPRSDRSATSLRATSGDGYRDFPNTLGGPNGYESSHGRLNQDHDRGGWSADAPRGRYGVDTETPSGPRLSNGNTQHGGRGGRAPAPLHTHVPPKPSTSTHGQPPAQSPDAITANGHLQRSGPRDQAPSRQANSESAATQAPASSPATPGIHPDRLRAMQESGPAPNKAGPTQAEGGRFARNAPANTISVAGSSRGPPSSSNHRQASNRDGPPPSGPGMTQDRGRDKRLENLQSTLQQSNGTSDHDRPGSGTTIRGRGGRGPSGAVDTAPPNLPAPRAVGPREDLFAGRASGPGHSSEDNGQTYGRRGPGRDGPSDMDRRASRIRSRSPRTDRPVDAAPPQYRERERAGLRDTPREQYFEERSSYPARNPADGGRDVRPGDSFERDARGGGHSLRRSGRGPERGAPDVGYDRYGQGDDHRDGGGSLRKRGRVEEGVDRSLDSKRPRRS